MAKSFCRIKRKDYDELCHFVRHLTSEVEAFDKRSDKFYRVIQDLAIELRETNKSLLAKVKVLDARLNSLSGTVADCSKCSPEKREECREQMRRKKVKVKR